MLAVADGELERVEFDIDVVDLEWRTYQRR